MPRHTGVTWEPWSTCSRCSFQYPISMLVSQQGLRVCTLFCMDDLSILYRPYIIEQVLGDPGSEELVPQTPQIQWSPEEIYF